MILGHHPQPTRRSSPCQVPTAGTFTAPQHLSPTPHPVVTMRHRAPPTALIAAR